MFVRRLALIARCLGTADVVDAVRFARIYDLELAVRGGGHSVVSQWLDPKDDEKNIAWERATYDVLRPHMGRESYANYQTEDEAEGASEQAYGPNYERLVALKNRVDPTNAFHLNTNVRPTV
jgi:FAD/FMN-containing dehydrogenase